MISNSCFSEIDGFESGNFCTRQLALLVSSLVPAITAKAFYCLRVETSRRSRVGPFAISAIALRAVEMAYLQSNSLDLSTLRTADQALRSRIRIGSQLQRGFAQPKWLHRWLLKQLLVSDEGSSTNYINCTESWELRMNIKTLPRYVFATRLHVRNSFESRTPPSTCEFQILMGPRVESLPKAIICQYPNITNDPTSGSIIQTCDPGELH
jgi:uncharacterized protein involved in high-affinity Fe2+ transport